MLHFYLSPKVSICTCNTTINFTMLKCLKNFLFYRNRLQYYQSISIVPILLANLNNVSYTVLWGCYYHLYARLSRKNSFVELVHGSATKFSWTWQWLAKIIAFWLANETWAGCLSIADEVPRGKLCNSDLSEQIEVRRTWWILWRSLKIWRCSHSAVELWYWVIENKFCTLQ